MRLMYAPSGPGTGLTDVSCATLRICLYSTSSKKPDALLNIMIGAMGLYSVEAKNDRTVQQFKRQA